MLLTLLTMRGHGCSSSIVPGNGARPRFRHNLSALPDILLRPHAVCRYSPPCLQLSVISEVRHGSISDFVIVVVDYFFCAARPCIRSPVIAYGVDRCLPRLGKIPRTDPMLLRASVLRMHDHFKRYFLAVHQSVVPLARFLICHRHICDKRFEKVLID